MVLGKIMKRRKSQDQVTKQVVEVVKKQLEAPAIEEAQDLEVVEDETEEVVEEEIEEPAATEETEEPEVEEESADVKEDWEVQNVAIQTEEVIYNSKTGKSLTTNQAIVKILNILEGI